MRDKATKMEDEFVRAIIEYGFKYRWISPVYKNRLCGFLWHRTHWECFLKGWEYRGKIYPTKMTAEEIVNSFE